MSRKLPSWRYQPPGGCPYDHAQWQPDPNKIPLFQPGDKVRLCGKPEKVRTVLSVEWHRYCHEYVYIVATSKPQYSYWFAPQLIAETEWQAMRD